MITSIDTNILIDVLGSPNTHTSTSVQALNEAIQRGSLVICPIVGAEISSSFKNTKDLQSVFKRMKIELSPFGWESLHEAGRIFVEYRRTSNTPKDRMLSDFLVAGHALHHADQLLTRDRGFYRFYFPKLKIVEVG